jgi:hypothetical protein
VRSIYEAQTQTGPEVIPWDRLPTDLSWKEKIAFLGVQFAHVLASECPVEHIIGHGSYIRKMTIPAGTVFLGREHLQGHEVTLLKGSVVLITPETKRQVDAITTLHTTPGFYMVVYTLTDVEAQTVHPNPHNSCDVVALEAQIFGPAEELRQLGLAVEERLLLT